MLWKNRRKRKIMIDTIHGVIHKVANDDPQTTEVVLKEAALQSDLLTALAMALISNTHVKTLYLASVNIYSHSAQVLASALIQNSSLETIWLEDNQICSIGASALATVLYVNKSIKTFGLRNNLIGNEGALHILNALQGNTRVEHVNLDGNSISHKLLAQIKALAERNSHVAVESNKPSKRTKKPTPKLLQNEPCSTCIKESLDCDLESSVTSRMTLETIMEESEPEDERW